MDYPVPWTNYEHVDDDHFLLVAVYVAFVVVAASVFQEMNTKDVAMEHHSSRNLRMGYGHCKKFVMEGTLGCNIQDAFVGTSVPNLR